MVALVDRNDASHVQCAEVVGRLPALPFTTTVPCITEAMFLLYQSGGHRFQELLWDYVARGAVRLHIGRVAEVARMRDLMRQYNDAPMDLADASLVVAAESLGIRRVFTLDRHFHAYRASAEWLEVIPLN